MTYDKVFGVTYPVADSGTLDSEEKLVALIHYHFYLLSLSELVFPVKVNISKGQEFIHICNQGGPKDHY